MNISGVTSLGLEHGVSEQELESLSDKVPHFLQEIEKKEQGFFSDEVLRNDVLLGELREFAQDARKKYTTFVLLGIGGSSLGPIALQDALESFDSEHHCIVLDNIDPDHIAEIESIIDLKETLFLSVSKSGGTPETVSQYFYFSKKITDAGLSLADHMVCITDPETSFLKEESEKRGIPRFPIPSNVGGRFSVLTPVGVLPALLMGIDATGLLQGACDMRTQFLSESAEENMPFRLATIQYILLGKNKNQNVLYSYSQKLFRMADWFRQLVAESTGKRHNTSGKEVHTGITPIASLGATDQHSQNQLYFEGPNDKFFLFLETRTFGTTLPIPASTDDDRFTYLQNIDFGTLLRTEMEGTKGALTEVHRPHVTISLSDISAQNIGGLFFLFEAATAFLGEFLEINAFDQPGVELGKNITKKMLLG